jgi:hypothetical protein
MSKRLFINITLSDIQYVKVEVEIGRMGCLFGVKTELVGPQRFSPRFTTNVKLNREICNEFMLSRPRVA